MAGELKTVAARARREMEPAWNDLREQRVLGRITEARRRRTVGRRRAAVGAVAAAAIALLGLAGWAAWGGAGGGGTVARNEGPARLDLRDGSTAVLSPEARVRVDDQRPDGTWLTQQSGTVTYDVTHDPARAFVVRAAHVTVRVRGTHFVVAMEPSFVEVSVDEGSVEVQAHGQATVLGAGDRIRVSATAAVSSNDEPPPSEGASVGEPPSEEPPADALLGVEPQREGEPAGRARTREARADPPPAPTLEDRLAEADLARRQGRVDEAAAILRAAVDAHPEATARLPAAHFTLGRLERRRGHHAAAAEAFHQARRIAPTGSLAEDALAEEAISWHAAGDASRARELARRYLDEHSTGLHAARVRAILE